MPARVGPSTWPRDRIPGPDSVVSVALFAALLLAEALNGQSTSGRCWAR